MGKVRVVEIETQDHQRRYVVIDDAGMLVEPIVRYLKYLDRIGSADPSLVCVLAQALLAVPYPAAPRLATGDAG